ncbi:NADAR family protein [Flavobacterium sp. NRK F10]|uniref:NADAR family protein n=1 Tax=Flavobacterium sp. NRK F10 TaxID=2954931 RepID=UPI0020900C2A|nr:NADAR family protein [Flavobacterium sp. NRK F10]MCO6175483.1 NADAR family protein [Flavobacterium sp. NRK F10]
MNKKGKYDIPEENVRVYNKTNSIIFKKNNESYGELSNMSMDFPLMINNIKVLNTEALYQACRFPHSIELQEKIIFEKSPMKVKMISNANKKYSREDWEDVKLKIMKWCLNVKLSQNFISFGNILDSTKNLNIVENSNSDNYWGAIPNEESSVFIGQNALGRLLMQLRSKYRSSNKFSLLIVEKPKIENFTLLGKEITQIDSRDKFLEDLENYFKNQQLDIFNNR